MGETGWSGGPATTGAGQKVIVPPGMPKSPSHASDPPGSFRDEKDKLWIYTGRGWMMYERYIELYPNTQSPFTTIVTGPKEVPQSHPTLLSGPQSAKTSGSEWSRNGAERGNVNSSDSPKSDDVTTKPCNSTEQLATIEGDEEEEDLLALLQLDAYQDWLVENWKALTYDEVHAMVVKEPEEAGDLIASLLGMKIKYREFNK
jgi:hypothetical protein